MQGRGKDRTAAGILAILLGSLGIHHFYLGSVGAGAAMLAVTLLTCGIGGVLTGIVALIEGIMVLTMTPEDFDSRFNNRKPENFEFIFMKPK